MRRTLILLTVACAAALTACNSSDNAGTATPASQGGSSTSSTTNNAASASSTEVTAWADKVCGAVVDSLAPFGTEPTLDESSPAAIKASFLDWLNKGAQTLDSGLKDLDTLKSGPDPDSAKAVTAFATLLAPLKTGIDTAVNDVKSADPNDLTQFQGAMQKVQADMAPLENLDKNIKEPTLSPALTKAFDAAPSCQELNK